MSRRLPHFNRESLELELPKHGIEYIWMKELGGHRKKILMIHPTPVCATIRSATMPTTC